MTKHTPGPWVVDGDGHSVSTTADVRPGRTHGYGCGAQFVASLNDGEYHEYASGSEQLANARLIAAAPEMYDALEPDLIEAIAHVCERMGWDERFRILKDVADKQRQAKAKAEEATP